MANNGYQWPFERVTTGRGAAGIQLADAVSAKMGALFKEVTAWKSQGARSSVSYGAIKEATYMEQCKKHNKQPIILVATRETIHTPTLTIQLVKQSKLFLCQQ